MAINGSISANSLNYKNIIIELRWERVSVKNNASTIRWTLEVLNRSTESIVLNTTRNFTVNIDGQTYTGKFPTHIAPGASNIIKTESTIIKHENDGTKTFEYGFSVPLGMILNTEKSGTDTLDPIPKRAIILSAPNFTDIESPTITYQNPAGNTLDKLQACIANSSGSYIFAEYRDIEKDGDSYTFNLTIGERNKLRASANGSMVSVRFYLLSVYGGVEERVHLDRTMTIDNAASPVLDSVAYDVDTFTTSLTGNGNSVILGYSNIYFDIKATAPEGAVIISQYAKCGDEKETTNNGYFSSPISNVVEFYAQDSRGKTVFKQITLNAIQYINITCNQKVILNADGTASLTVEGNYFSNSFGAKNNTITIETRSRKQGEEWTEWGDISVLLAEASNGKYKLTGNISGFDPSGTYEFQTRATDRLTSAESAISTITLVSVFDWSRNDFNFNVPVTIEGNPVIDYVIETGREPMGTNGTWYWSKWRSGKAECYGCRNYGNTSIYNTLSTQNDLFSSEVFNQDLPSGLFNNIPDVIDITVRNATLNNSITTQKGYGLWIIKRELELPTSNTTGSFSICSRESGIKNAIHLSFNIIGRWK